ncbi:MAG: GNAT family N-acetyltransferase [Eubacteriaceae bacterium]|nr:GNAT family N-acetyltransferase [Eubacteriaceae bacterium]
MQAKIRTLKDDETDLLQTFLYEAIFVPEGAAPPPREIIEKPELRVYTDDFGQRKGDNGLVAVMDHQVVGAVWTRIMDDDGHVDDETPSFAIALYPAYRGQGIGTALMKAMLALFKNQGYRQGSLAVQKANDAVKLYRDVGFEIVDENAEEYIMVCTL